MNQYHHFYITPALVAATSWTEAVATLKDMDKFGLCKLPYSECAISVRVAGLLNDGNWFLQDTTLDVPDESIVYALLKNYFAWEPDPTGGPALVPLFAADPRIAWVHDDGRVRLIDLDRQSALGQEFINSMRSVVSYAAMILITSLGAANVQASTSVNRRAARGIGHGKFRGPLDGIIYISTTTVAPPAFPTGGGVSPRPHLRRGHIHTFHVGQGRTGTIRKFVQPVFVNWNPGDPPPQPRKYVVRP